MRGVWNKENSVYLREASEGGGEKKIKKTRIVVESKIQRICDLNHEWTKLVS